MMVLNIGIQMKTESLLLVIGLLCSVVIKSLAEPDELKSEPEPSLIALQGVPVKISPILDPVNKRLDILEAKLDTEQKRLDGVILQLLPLLEQVYNICLSDSFFGKGKCDVGDIRCTEINLLDNTFNCLECVNGTDVPVTDDGSLDHCTHFVSLEKAGIEIRVEQDELEFHTVNGTLEGISPKLSHSVEGIPNCNCSWAFYNYTSLSNTQKISNLNRLLKCSTGNCNDTKGWLCLADSDQVGKCYNPTAPCHIQHGVIPTCSLPEEVELKLQVETNCSKNLNLTSDGTIDNCEFEWNLDPRELHWRDKLFIIEWKNENKNKIQNFKCKSGDGKEFTCSTGNDIFSCKKQNTAAVYKYDFSTCRLINPNNEITSKPPGPDNSSEPDSGSGATTWLVLIIVIILVVFLSYVVYQNYQKISDCVNGIESGGRPPPTSRGRGRGRIKGKYGPIPMEEVVTRHDE